MSDIQLDSKSASILTQTTLEKYKQMIQTDDWNRKVHHYPTQELKLGGFST